MGWRVRETFLTKHDIEKDPRLDATQKNPQTTRSLLHRVAPGLHTFIHYNHTWLGRDLSAGLSVAAIALPVGIAYSAIAGVPPVVGIYSSIFPLFAYALFGSSRQLMTGPDAATCIIVAAGLTPLANDDPERYLALLVVLTIMTGLFYIGAGFLRLGFIANFLSNPILAGYLNGIALIIVAGQLKTFLGYSSKEGEFYLQLTELFYKIKEFHYPTAILGVGLLIVLIVMKRRLPKIPGAMVVVILGIVAVIALDLKQIGVAVLGEVPAGLPAFHFTTLNLEAFRHIFGDAAGLVLISFTSGILTAKSFARRNQYEIDSNQELFAFGACNLASGLGQGFPVTGADSRTAVNDAMGGKTQMVGMIAGLTMLLVLFFGTAPLAEVPSTALAAVIMVSAVGLLDTSSLRDLFRTSRREFFLSIITTVGVLVLGALPGVILSVALSLLWLLTVAARPHSAILGRVQGVKGFHDILDYPNARTIDGLLLFRFQGNLVFFNVDYFRECLIEAIAASKTPIEWVVLDASPINVLDATAMQKLDEIRNELAPRGIVLVTAQARHNLRRFFEPEWVRKREELWGSSIYPTLKSAIHVFHQYKNAKGGLPPPD